MAQSKWHEAVMEVSHLSRRLSALEVERSIKLADHTICSTRRIEKSS